MTSTGDTTRHVTILAARFWPDLYGGVEQRLWQTALGLIDAGVTVHVITENRGDLPPAETVRPGLTVTRLPRMDFGRLWRWPDAVRVRWWRRAVREHAAPGVLWACEPTIALGAILAGRRHDVTFNPACCAAGMHVVFKAYPFVHTMKMPLLSRWADRLAYRLSRRVVVSSANVAMQARHFYGRTQKIDVVPHGVDTCVPKMTSDAARRSFGLPADAFVVGFVGRLDPCKDLGFLFEAASRNGLGEKGHILIVGDGPDRRRLEGFAADLNLSDRITWVGRSDDPRSAYAAMDVMVLPSVYEAFGNVVREAMAASVPVIGRRRHGDSSEPILTANDELIDHGRTGLVVPPHDPDSLAFALHTLRSQPEEVARMGRNARLDALAWPWSRTVEMYLDLLGIPRRSRHAAAA